MATGLGEQLEKWSSHHGRTKNWRWWAKRYHARGHRRAAKRLLDDAPPRNKYSGWAY